MKTLIIAEAGVNHNGSLELAFQLIDAAVAAKVDIVKFQTFKASKLVTKSAPKANYQKIRTGNSHNQLEMLKKLELKEEEFLAIANYCDKRGIEFMSTPFDDESLHFLTTQTNMKRLKIPSGEISNAPFLLSIAKKKLPIILSTGMCALRDIEMALGILAFGLIDSTHPPSEEAFQLAFGSQEGQDSLLRFVSILHCTTEYPAPAEEINLRAMDTIRAAFQLPTGYSDHSAGIVVPSAAVAREAKIIEKHFTINKNMIGPDHAASLEPQELKEMVENIRLIECALGSYIKSPTKSELPNLKIARKSLVAKLPIQKGETFSVENLAVKRPGVGISPIRYWDFLGDIAKRNYEEDEIID